MSFNFKLGTNTGEEIDGKREIVIEVYVILHSMKAVNHASSFFCLYIQLNEKEPASCSFLNTIVSAFTRSKH